MGSKKSVLHLATLSLAVSLGLAIIPRFPAKVQAQQRQTSAQRIPGSWEISQAFQAPNRGAPTSTAGGASRGEQCQNDGDTSLRLTALMPTDKFGLTVTANPKIFFYIPTTSASTAEFVLKDDRDTDIYRQTFPITGTPGIVSLSPFQGANRPSLEKGKNYKWYLVLRCNSTDQINDPFVEGWMELTDPSPTLAQQLKEAPQERDRLALYAKNGIWYEALSTIAELRRTDPNNSAVATSWEELLKSVGLEQIAKEPLVDCCKAATTTASP
ncbi:DUF928 domain-containing protein [Planktothrix sp. FACHB-1355]|uniref:DUF928 domain-containing protein n=1 Tax=Aerosakkonema funiforme FACHB-1375 TaxID=2949571 RepID=A0A926ZHB2_9CYAN|nr:MULTISPECIES: DUF928 domain-containing protein [Oscillatoriales]MBD2182840.1 DUF928 domain-containing protein [Aerosakkonema funiforme FACHB-1375]MBD3560041.1 DUF928 domain-containing protein [Planktothrix sp. FACHB-1355]